MWKTVETLSAFSSICIEEFLLARFWNTSCNFFMFKSADPSIFFFLNSLDHSFKKCHWHISTKIEKFAFEKSNVIATRIFEKEIHWTCLNYFQYLRILQRSFRKNLKYLRISFLKNCGWYSVEIPKKNNNNVWVVPKKSNKKKIQNMFFFKIANQRNC